MKTKMYGPTNNPHREKLIYMKIYDVKSLKHSFIQAGEVSKTNFQMRKFVVFFIYCFNCEKNMENS